MFAPNCLFGDDNVFVWMKSDSTFSLSHRRAHIQWNVTYLVWSWFINTYEVRVHRAKRWDMYRSLWYQQTHTNAWEYTTYGQCLWHFKWGNKHGEVGEIEDKTHFFGQNKIYEPSWDMRVTKSHVGHELCRLWFVRQFSVISYGNSLHKKNKLKCSVASPQLSTSLPTMHAMKIKLESHWFFRKTANTYIQLPNTSESLNQWTQAVHGVRSSIVLSTWLHSLASSLVCFTHTQICFFLHKINRTSTNGIFLLCTSNCDIFHLYI